MTVEAGDARWCAWLDMAVARGKTPNQAVPIADRLTEDQHGPRPVVGVGEKPNQEDR